MYQIYCGEKSPALILHDKGKIADEDMSQEMLTRFHHFKKEDIPRIQNLLLQWYAKNKREMPWRNLPTNITLHNKAYRILVSEIMLQQTQVSVVINYYNNWIRKWPSLQSLSSATLEEVQTVWKGLGYYSRARRLLTIAQQLDSLPETATELSKLAGIGTYTAGAVASIVFQERQPAVDGNVTRVLCRLRSIGGVATTARVKNTILEIARSLVPQDTPGDWNQALIELGATVCSPRQPDCPNCPVNAYCRAFQNEVHDIEDCWLCLPDRGNATPLDFPRKQTKTLARKEYNVVCIVCENERYFVVKRDSSGLLADLWQFPSFSIVKDFPGTRLGPRVKKFLKQNCNLSTSDLSFQWIGDVSHKFSHIDMTYKVVLVGVKTSEKSSWPTSCCAKEWVSGEEFDSLPVSTAMRKVFKAYQQGVKKKSSIQ